MDATEDEDDLRLIKASAGLLNDLESHLPKILWRPLRENRVKPSRKAHSQVKKRDLDGFISLIEPFQGEPQLLDTRLKIIVPQVVNAYLQYLSQEHSQRYLRHTDFESAVCSILYTLCKVRGYKVIVGFFNNEPRCFIPILQALERTCGPDNEQSTSWQVPYILLLWLSHLLLTPFDLVSISTESVVLDPDILPGEFEKLPPLMRRVLHLGLRSLSSPTKTQEAAASALARLITRPDVQRLQIADTLVAHQLQKLRGTDPGSSGFQPNIYETLGCLRFLAKVASLTELSHLIPQVYRSCERLSQSGDDNVVASNAVAKKIVIKIFRNVANLSLRAVPSSGPLVSFLETTNVLEDVIDHLLQSLADQDTPVRYAAAKAISIIILGLETSMGHEVIQAILDTFKEDLPRSSSVLTFTTANPLKWHGITLALAHALFNRSASPEQIPDILVAMISASQFQQRTATGTFLGTNVRDAANFGIWSLARRYNTANLLSVSSGDLLSFSVPDKGHSVIQIMAAQLLLSACLDPAGNIRRGSSAALQELIGRHPDQVFEGIPLVQVVDYQAVGLRHRAMVEVANKAARLHEAYWRALLDGLLGWRGLGSVDALARESAAESISKLAHSSPATRYLAVLDQVLTLLQQCSTNEAEDLHGLLFAAARLIDGLRTINFHDDNSRLEIYSQKRLHTLWTIGEKLQQTTDELSSRSLRSELPASISCYVSAVCNLMLRAYEKDQTVQEMRRFSWLHFDSVTDRLLARHEGWITRTIPEFVQSQHNLKRRLGCNLGSIDPEHLVGKINSDCTRSTIYGSGRVTALGVLAPQYGSDGLASEKARTALSTLTNMLSAASVEWRIVGAHALRLMVEHCPPGKEVSETVASTIAHAVCQGLRDYTIDERGDIGSLVRLRAIACASKLLASDAFRKHKTKFQDLKAEIYRLSLEKLDRVRLQAAICRHEHLDLSVALNDVASVSSLSFFIAAMKPLTSDAPDWVKQAILEGCVSSCSVSSAESLIQASRSALAAHMESMDQSLLLQTTKAFAMILKSQLTTSALNPQPALELLAFLLDMRLVQDLESVKWRNILSSVQKSHYKSNDIPRILAAIHVYAGLAEIESIRGEVLKKLVSMLKTNPYPRVRIATAETLWRVTADTELQTCDWGQPAARHNEVITHLHATYVV